MNPRRFGDILYCFLAIGCLLISQVATATGINIQGIEDEEIEQNIRLHLKNLELNTATIDDAFWQKQIRDTVATAVEPFGYYNSESVVTANRDEIDISISLSDPLIITNVTREIIGEGRADPAFRSEFDAFPLAVGDVLHQPTYETFKLEMFNYALTHGFFDFTWQASRLDLVREENQANVLLIAQSGPQYYFGEVVIKGDSRSSAIVNRLKPFATGDKYNAGAVTEFNRRLNQTGFYQRVIARPVVSDAVNNQVPVEITLEHKPKDTFNVGLGFSTDTGIRVPIEWRRPWVNRRGHSITSNLFLSEREQFLSSDYRIPMHNVNDDYASIALGFKFLDDTETDTESETFSLSGRRYWREKDSNWQRILSLSYERENFTQGLDEAQTTDLLMPGVSISYFDQPETLDVDNGMRFFAGIEIGSKALISDIDIIKATANAKWIRSFGSHRFMLRGEGGAIETNDFSRVPATMRFFAGGDQSIRGFSFNTLSPFTTDSPDGEPILTGGRYLVTGSIEYSYPIFDNIRGALFVDAGTVTNDFDESLSHSAGFGVHWLTVAGPLRFYLAFGDSEQNDRSIMFHFSMGPEL